MRYESTRGAAPLLGFADTLLTGLAADGGLYLPERWPALEGLPEPAGPYAELATAVMAPFVGDDIDRDELARLVAGAYAGFDHPEVVPLRPLEDGLWLLELFHGPTLAFKDMALQVVGRLLDRELAHRDERATVIVATSGDTGSAAIEACRGRDRLDIVVLHPHGRVSDVQRRQMTTVHDHNVWNLAVEGTFDDCQDLVKALFADAVAREKLRLTAMNSINWARVLAQIPYYVRCAALLGGAGPVDVTVPTGNFGNIYAAWGARSCGAGLGRLVVASNRNDILTRTLETGVMATEEVHATLSPAMDIQVSSNVERLLYELHDRDGTAVAEAMRGFRESGSLRLAPAAWARLRAAFAGERVDDERTLATIAEVYREHSVLIDPHTAVGVAVARTHRSADRPMVVAATAHPAKFPDAVEAATGVSPPVPGRLAAALEAPEHYDVVPADLGSLRAALESRFA